MTLALRSLKKLWKSSPKLRFAARTVAVAVAGYVVQTVRSGQPLHWQTFAAGIGTAAITALVGLFTPLEPFVGVNKTKVDVPAPPATVPKRAKT
jgi:hypothetical protein